MTHIHIISGFLGAGKTTFIKKLIPELSGKVALIENEFGEIGVDGDLLVGNLPIKEIYAGCICCTVVRDFERAIVELIRDHRPDHIIIEPSGVASLSDIIKVCKTIAEKSDRIIELQNVVTIVDVSAFEDSLESFGTFYIDQIKNGKALFLSHLDPRNKEVEKILGKIQHINPGAYISPEDWYTLDGGTLMKIVDTVANREIGDGNKVDAPSADQVFTTLSIGNPRVIYKEDLEKIFTSLAQNEFGQILRAKGILSMDPAKAIYFDYTPHHRLWEYIHTSKKRKLVFIGRNLEKERILKTFQE